MRVRFGGRGVESAAADCFYLADEDPREAILVVPGGGGDSVDLRHGSLSPGDDDRDGPRALRSCAGRAEGELCNHGSLSRAYSCRGDGGELLLYAWFFAGSSQLAFAYRSAGGGDRGT